VGIPTQAVPVLAPAGRPSISYRAGMAPNPHQPDATSPSAVEGLTVLGSTVRHPIEHLECFPAPDGCSRVRFTTEEISSICPVTGQPDLSSMVIDYLPDERCVESKSLKLYLWSFRDRAVFAEALAAEVAREVMDTARPRWVEVTVTQRPRGGISIQTVSELGSRTPG
jgi:7-cyano-7-deazaguanine reductase